VAVQHSSQTSKTEERSPYNALAANVDRQSTLANIQQ